MTAPTPTPIPTFTELVNQLAVAAGPPETPATIATPAYLFGDPAAVTVSIRYAQIIHEPTEPEQFPAITCIDTARHWARELRTIAGQLDQYAETTARHLRAAGGPDMVAP